MSWRSINREEIDDVWKKLAEQIEEEVQGKYTVEDGKTLRCDGIVGCEEQR